MSEGQRVPTSVLLRSLLSLGVFFVILGVTLFLPAGDLRWGKGWLLLLAYFVLAILSVLYLWRVNPDIFLARSRIHPGTKRWDKVLLAFLLPSFGAIFLVGALDAGRFHWSHVAPVVIVLGYLLLGAGFLVSIWAESVNKFAEPGVRLQTERGHKVIDTGPYALVRHPLYGGGFFIAAGTSLALGSWWALIPAAVGAALIVVRTVLEDKMLQEELEGYKEYAGRVRYRLIPGIW